MFNVLNIGSISVILKTVGTNYLALPNQKFHLALFYNKVLSVFQNAIQLQKNIFFFFIHSRSFTQSYRYILAHDVVMEL